MIRFDWDAEKAEANLKKHEVAFEEARTVFSDDYARQFFDEDNSEDEDRFLLLGVSSRSRLLIVCHCVREEGESTGGEEVIRIISARKATAAERTFYEGPLP